MAGYQFFIRFGHLFRFCPVISNHSFKKPGLLQTFMSSWICIFVSIVGTAEKTPISFFKNTFYESLSFSKGQSIQWCPSRRNIKGFFVWHGKVFYVWCLVSLFEKGYYKVSPFLWFITHGYGRRTTKTYLSTLGEIHERGKRGTSFGVLAL